MERQRFEDSWKEAFKDAEVSPSENLWTNIELDLEKAEGKKMKKRILYFKLLAAASVAFAMTFAGVGYVYMNNQNDGFVAQNNTAQSSAQEKIQSGDATEKTKTIDNSKNKQTITEPSVAAHSERITDPSQQNTLVDKSSTETESTQRSASGHGANQSVADVSVKNSGSQSTLSKKSELEKQGSTGNKIAHQSTSKAANGVGKDREPMFDSANDAVNKNGKQTLIASTPTTEDERLFANARLPEIVHVRKPAYHHQASHADPVQLMLAKLADEERNVDSKKTKGDKRSKKGGEHFWTSVGVAAGSFNTVVSDNRSTHLNSEFNLSTASTQFDASQTISNNIVQKQSAASGTSYVVGLQLGGKLSERWVLQGGVNYMTQSSDYSTNAVVGSSDYSSFKVGSINELNNAARTDRIVNTAAYNVNSNLQYLSVPLQAGYLIINRDIGLQFNAGVSTDLFLQNTLTPDEGSLEETKQGPGDESPYRTVNFSGLVSTELSYRFGAHYRVAVNPGLRYPFNSIYKSEIEVDAMPLTFDVGLRFRYIFN